MDDEHTYGEMITDNGNPEGFEHCSYGLWIVELACCFLLLYMQLFMFFACSRMIELQQLTLKTGRNQRINQPVPATNRRSIYFRHQDGLFSCDLNPLWHVLCVEFMRGFCNQMLRIQKNQAVYAKRVFNAPSKLAHARPQWTAMVDFTSKTCDCESWTPKPSVRFLFLQHPPLTKGCTQKDLRK